MLSILIYSLIGHKKDLLVIQSLIFRILNIVVYTILLLSLVEVEILRHNTKLIGSLMQLIASFIVCFITFQIYNTIGLLFYKVIFPILQVLIISIIRKDVFAIAFLCSNINQFLRPILVIVLELYVTIRLLLYLIISQQKLTLVISQVISIQYR